MAKRDVKRGEEAFPPQKEKELETAAVGVPGGPKQSARLAKGS
jgi:hypothetical protein